MQIFHRIWQERWLVNNLFKVFIFPFNMLSIMCIFFPTPSRKPTYLDIRYLIRGLTIRVRTNFCTDKNTFPSCVYTRTAELDELLEQLSVRVWDLKKRGYKI